MRVFVHAMHSVHACLLCLHVTPLAHRRPRPLGSVPTPPQTLSETAPVAIEQKTIQPSVICEEMHQHVFSFRSPSSCTVLYATTTSGLGWAARPQQEHHHTHCTLLLPSPPLPSPPLPLSPFLFSSLVLTTSASPHSAGFYVHTSSTHL